MGDGHQPGEPVELYGIIEIATALGVDRRKVAVWHGRGKLPPADFRASGRPFWKPDTITPWITAQQPAMPEPVAELVGAADQVDHVDQSPRPAQASSPATPPPPPSRSRSRRPAAAEEPARPRSRSAASGRRAPTVDQRQDQDQGGDRGKDPGEDPYELVRRHGGQGWTLTYLGRPIGTVRPAWSTTGRSKRWQAHSPTGTRLDARTYATVRAAAVRVAQAHRAAGRRR